MATNNAFPFGLLRANIELHLRVAQLLHENSQRWLGLASRVSQEGAGEYKAEIENLGQTSTWQTLLALPAEAFWRQVQQRFADAQNATQIAIENQAAFTQGLQQAIQSWQKSSIGGIEPGGAKLPFLDYFGNWGAQWAPAEGGAAKKKGDAHVG